MGRIAILNSDVTKVINVILADASFADNLTEPYKILVDGEECGIGDDHTAGVFTKPAVILDPIVIDQVKAEAGRRIEAVMSLHKQRNNLARAIENMMGYGADPVMWPPEEQTAQVAAIALWTQIKTLRTKSNFIESLDPIPLDYTANSHWT